jgi:hypothetical protein
MAKRYPIRLKRNSIPWVHASSSSSERSPSQEIDMDQDYGCLLYTSDAADDM